MVKIKISHETPEEKATIMEAISSVIQPASAKGYVTKNTFQRFYITGKIKKRYDGSSN